MVMVAACGGRRPAPWLPVVYRLYWCGSGDYTLAQLRVPLLNRATAA
ncbi:hypothetical protein [Streptomyces sp. SBT349]|nr:hypothetical protein [Streptomyces sp. SBT349]